MLQPESDALAADVRDLQTRVARLEYQLGLAPATPPAVAPANRARDHAEAAAQALESPSSLLPYLGRALLGLAGAYLLRALTESAMFPARAGVAIGVAYAMLWLVWAARTPAARRLETALHGLTGALVVSPLLFEATARFHVISTWTAALLLFAFTVFGFAVSWRKDLLIVATFATLAGLGTSAALLLATHDAMPFTFLFLAVAAAVEVSACLNHWLSERWLTATAADLAVLLATWLVTNERGVPETYVPIAHSALLAAQVALIAIYLSSTIVRTLLRGFTFTGFETAQCALAFLLGVGGGLRLTSHDPRVAPSLAVLMLGCAAACYLVSFRVLDRGGAHGRNFYTYSTFGILLTIAGSRILLSGMAASLAWSALAVACMWAGGAFRRLTLQVHGAVFLLLALAASSAIQQAAGLLLGDRAWPAGEVWPIWSGAAAAAACFLLATRASGASAHALRIVKAATLIWLSAGIVAGLLTFAYHAVFGEAATHAYCATLRTSVIAAAALALAWSGARWSRLEFSRLIYPLMILGAWRMVTVDLRQERKAALFLSLLLYGATLILLPRIMRATQVAPADPTPQ